MTVDPVSLREAWSRFASGVAVVATRHQDGGVCGLTANSFTSVSLDPPLALVCVDRGASTLACLREAGAFTASFLAAGQASVARRFTERRDDKFDGIPTRQGVTGIPILEGALGHVECLVEDEHPAGDHAIVVGRIVAVSAGLSGAEGEGDGGRSNAGRPLVFFRHGYTTTAGGDG